jgi:divalent metal cation (Fe/Co/Zn/Cd) transporter
MDRRDPEVEANVREVLDAWKTSGGGSYHELRNRVSGDVVWVDVHLLFAGRVGLERAHADATGLELEIQERIRPRQLVITTHLEPLGSHDDAHPPEDGAHLRG